MFFKGLLALLMTPIVATIADDGSVAPTQVVTEAAVPGITAPFVVDATTLFTNDISQLSYDALTNLLDLTQVDLNETGEGLPVKREAQREARIKALRENPDVQVIRKQIADLQKQAEGVAEKDPAYVAAYQAWIDAQHDMMVLAKKIQLLSGEIRKRNELARSGGTSETNKP